MEKTPRTVEGRDVGSGDLGASAIFRAEGDVKDEDQMPYSNEVGNGRL